MREEKRVPLSVNSQDSLEKSDIILYQSPLALITPKVVRIGQTTCPVSRLEGVSVRRRSRKLYGVLALLALMSVLYGLGLSQSGNLPPGGIWRFSFSLSERPVAWFLMVFGGFAFLPLAYFTFFAPFGLYLEISDGVKEEEILVMSALSDLHFQKISRAAEKAMDMDFAPSEGLSVALSPSLAALAPVEGA